MFVLCVVVNYILKLILYTVYIKLYMDIPLLIAEYIIEILPKIKTI